MVLGPKWQLPNEDAAPALVHIYYIIDLVILSIGLVTFTRTIFMWRIAFSRVNSVLQSYIWIAIGDGALAELSSIFIHKAVVQHRYVTLINFFFMSAFGLAYGHLPDTDACKVNAFISMWLAYAISHVYLTASGIALMIMMGYSDKKARFKRVAFWFAGGGYIYGTVISLVYGLAGMYGNYRNMYCMIPVDKYNEWGLIMGFFFYAFQLFVCFIINVVSYRMSKSVALEKTLGPVEKATRVRAYNAIQKANLSMLAIFCVCQSIVVIVEILIWIKAPIPIVMDLFTGFFYKAQPALDSLLIYQLLHKVVERELNLKKIPNLPWYKQVIYWFKPPMVSPEVSDVEAAKGGADGRAKSESSIVPPDPSASAHHSSSTSGARESGGDRYKAKPGGDGAAAAAASNAEAGVAATGAGTAPSAPQRESR